MHIGTQEKKSRMQDPIRHAHMCTPPPKQTTNTAPQSLAVHKIEFSKE